MVGHAAGVGRSALACRQRRLRSEEGEFVLGGVVVGCIVTHMC